MTTVVFTGVFSYFLIRADIDAIRGDWANRRCELPVVLVAGFAKPNENTQTPMEFAQDNFKFCASQLVDSVLKVAFAPLYAVTGQQVNALNTMSGPMNSFRNMLKNARDSLGRLLDKQYRQYISINASLLKTWQHLLFSMGRIQAIFTSVVYFGLSASALVQNTLQFTYKSILTFIGIMAAMIILLFFVLFPFIPVIMTMITILVAAGFGAAAGMSGAFCVDPEAIVSMKDGTKKRLREIQLGDQLFSEDSAENKVTGILAADAFTTPLVEIEGVLMSGSHRVKVGDCWVLARDHPYALKVPNTILPQLICLNTTQHSVPIQKESGDILHVGDWEEVSDENGRRVWIELVHKHLNTGALFRNEYPTQVPLVSPSTIVFDASLGPVPIRSVKIGDTILSLQKRKTKVIGIYRGRIQVDRHTVEEPEWMTDGVWFKRADQSWTTAQKAGLKLSNDADAKELDGLYLITEDEQFVLVHKGIPCLVRDFTEIGASNIDSTYDELDKCMNGPCKK
jgi:hypothetical protein